MVTYEQDSCVSCLHFWENREYGGVPPMIVPVNPEAVAIYFCRECFFKFPLERLVEELSGLIMTEEKIFREQRERWSVGALNYEPLHHLNASIKFLLSYTDRPPFPHVQFMLRDLYIKGYPNIASRGHLALISFE